MSVVEILDSFGSDYEPKHGGFAPKIEVLGDGAYDFEIMEGAVKKSTSGETIFGLMLRVGEGAVVQHDYWLTDQGTVNRLGADLLALGFKTENLQGLKAVLQQVEAGKASLVGIRFRGLKGSYLGKRDKMIHTLRVVSRLNGSQKSGTPAASSDPPMTANGPPAETVPF